MTGDPAFASAAEFREVIDRTFTLLSEDAVMGPRLREADAGTHAADLAGLPSADLAQLIQDLTDQMKAAAAELQFEVAARLRDEISELKKELRQMMEATK